MPRIREASVREAVDAADMVEVVSARTQLRRSGARWTGLCPFHDEKKPSFSVNPADKLFYCFGCGKGGDVISFVRATEQLEFAQAVEWLAERYRVTLEYVVIAGVNCGADDAAALCELLRGIPVRLNLIDVNDATGRFLPPSDIESDLLHGGAEAVRA